MPDDHRQVKKRFQPSITSYFAQRDHETDRSTHTSRPEATTSSATPTLPAAVQSSLLNVGMRVRKSVPEGYRTKGVFHPIAASLEEDHPAPHGRRVGYSSIQERHTRELTPFCGILKIGGYDPAPCDLLPEAHAVPPLEFDGLDENGFPCSSQESNTSLQSMELTDAPTQPLNPYKRRFEEDDDNESIEPVIFEDDGIAPFSPQQSQSLGHGHVHTVKSSRPLAQVKGRRKHAQPTSPKYAMEGQENLESSHAGNGEDFDEAGFLLPSEQISQEVDMWGTF